MATVLIIDDQAISRQILGQIVKSIDATLRIESFEDAQSALGWLERSSADLILTDYKMPGMNGIEFLRRARSLPMAQYVPIIMITAQTDTKVYDATTSSTVTPLVSGLQGMGQTALSAGAVVLRGVGTLLAWAVLPVYFAFFLMADPGRFADLEKYLPFLKPETRKDLVYLAREFVNMVVSFFRGQLIVALLQGLLFAIGFSAVGLKYGFVLGLVLGFLNIIPYLGSIVGLSVALPLALFQTGGGWVLVAWVLGVFALVQMIEGYLLTPKIMGDRTGLHPVAIIVAVVFFGSLWGVWGVFFAIPLATLIQAVLNAWPRQIQQEAPAEG